MRLGLVCVVLFACHKEPGPPPELEISAPAHQGGETLACLRNGKTALLGIDDAGLHVRLETAPGNRVALFGHEVVAVAGEDATFPDALARFADARAGQEWLDVEAKVSSPDGRAATEKISLRIDHALTKRLEGARTAAVRFSGETLTASAKKLAYVRLAEESRAPIFIGQGRWRDVDLVAFESATSTGGKDCGTVEAPPGSFVAEVPVIASGTTSHVELYDRRAGTRIAESTFVTPGQCKREREAGDPSAPNEAAIRAWVASSLSP